MQDNILNTKILCYDIEAEEKAKLLGLDDSEVPEKWMNISIDLMSVVAIRENYQKYNEDVMMVTLYTSNEEFTVIGDYNEIKNKWLKFR